METTTMLLIILLLLGLSTATLAGTVLVKNRHLYNCKQTIFMLENDNERVKILLNTRTETSMIQYGKLNEYKNELECIKVEKSELMDTIIDLETSLNISKNIIETKDAKLKTAIKSQMSLVSKAKKHSDIINEHNKLVSELNVIMNTICEKEKEIADLKKKLSSKK